MQCPKCKKGKLIPAVLDDNLAAMGCDRCGGTLVALLYYRVWADRHPSVLAESCDMSVEQITTDNHAGAMSCPKCSRIMTKFHVSGELDNQIDLCSNCDEAWLDSGEWELLKALELGSHMPQIFSEPWQRRLRKERSDIVRRKHFEHIMGHEALLKADEFKKWLVNQPKREDIMLYLRLGLNEG